MIELVFKECQVVAEVEFVLAAVSLQVIKEQVQGGQGDILQDTRVHSIAVDRDLQQVNYDVHYLFNKHIQTNIEALVYKQYRNKP